MYGMKKNNFYRTASNLVYVSEDTWSQLSHCKADIASLRMQFLPQKDPAVNDSEDLK